MIEKSIKINVDCRELDIAIEKAKRLAELLEEVKQIANSLLALKN